MSRIKKNTPNIVSNANIRKLFTKSNAYKFWPKKYRAAHALDSPSII